MILVNNISQLQQNNLAYKEELFFQPVVSPADISLQTLLPKQVQNNYSFEAHLMSFEGDEFLADITADFYALFGTSIYNQNYLNLRLKVFGEAFSNVELFLIKIIVKNNEQILFVKFTEPYRKLQSSKVCYAVIDEFAMQVINMSGYIKINTQVFQFGQGLQDAGFSIDYNEGNFYVFLECDDVVEIGYCYQNEDVIIQVPLTATEFIQEDGCILPLVKLSGIYNCFDNVKGAYYGEPKTFLNYSANEANLIHQQSFYIHAQIELQPAEIKREITFLGKPQRVEHISKYNLTGLQVFPDWMMKEIESVFSAKRIYVDGIEYISKGGKAFSRDEIQGSNAWILKASLEDKPKINDFSCLDDCMTSCYYFVIPYGTKDQDYYNENKSKIGDTYQELLDFFANMPDVISVTDVDISTLNCNVVAVIKIDSFGYIPSFIYFKMPLNEYRIFSKFDDCETPLKLCDGISGCVLPSGITSSFEEYVSCALTPRDITSLLIDLDVYTNENPVELYNNWIIQNYEIRSYENAVSIAFELTNPNVTDVTDINDQNLFLLPENCRPSTDAILDDGDNSFLVGSNGIVSVSGNTLNNVLKLNLTTYNK